MGAHRVFVAVTGLVVVVLCSAPVAAQRRAHERRVMTGNVVVTEASQPVATQPVTVREVQVREVQVREVRVTPPVVSPQHAQTRHDAGPQRPVLPPFISRPGTGVVTQTDTRRDSTRTDSRRGHGGRRRFYTFRPKVNAGFGVLVGYPVVYPYAYPYVDPYAPFAPNSYASYVSAAPPRNTYSNVESVTPASSVRRGVECDAAGACGGISFEIEPADAQVSVDGVFAGTVDDFSASDAPLVLAPGNHYVEVRLPGFRSASFDVTIVAGEVTPYQGTLERLRTR